MSHLAYLKRRPAQTPKRFAGWCQLHLTAVAACAMVFLVGCANSGLLPTTPTPKSDTPLAAVETGVSGIDFGRCLERRNVACFSAGSMTTRVNSSAIGAPLNLVAAVTGTTVTLSWGAPIDEIASAFLIEAGSAPGAADLANITTGNSTTTFVATNVPVGLYFVRLRAIGPSGIGPVSNEVTVVVGSAPTAPSPGGGLVGGKVAAALTDDPRIPAIVVGVDGSMLSVVMNNGAVAGAILRTPSGDQVAVMVGPDGLPSLALLNETIVVYGNYTSTTVDVAIIAPNGRTIIRGVTRPAVPAASVVANALASGALNLSLATLLRAGTILMSGVTCGGAFLAAPQTLGASLVAASACTTLVVEAYSLYSESNNPVLEGSRQAMGTVNALIRCANITNPAACALFLANFAYNVSQDYIASKQPEIDAFKRELVISATHLVIRNDSPTYLGRVNVYAFPNQDCDIYTCRSDLGVRLILASGHVDPGQQISVDYPPIRVPGIHTLRVDISGYDGSRYTPGYYTITLPTRFQFRTIATDLGPRRLLAGSTHSDVLGPFPTGPGVHMYTFQLMP
jgi:hypothetical protein